MDVEVGWQSVGDTQDSAEERSNGVNLCSKRGNHKPSLQLKEQKKFSPSFRLSCTSAGPSDKQELPMELQCEDGETYEACNQKWCEATTGISVNSSTNFDLQCEVEDLELSFSGSPEEAQGALSEDNENVVRVDTFDEDFEPVSREAFLNRCRKCGTSFQDLARLQEHREIHIAEHPYRCPICGKEFCAANLRMHKLIHSSDRPHKCPECDKGFIGTADVWRHLQNVHKIEHTKVALGNDTMKISWSANYQNEHEADPDKQSSEGQKPRGEELRPYVCQTCGKGFCKPNLLSKHKVIHRQEKPYLCQECGRAFIQLLRLKRHQQTHSGEERPFYCDECGGTFTRLSSLQRHQCIHTGEKPYSCVYCGHSFTESGTMRRHELTHKVGKD